MQAKVEKEMGAVQGLPPSRITLGYVNFEISYEATVATSICLIIISYTDPAGAAVSRERKEEEADSRSVFVGNVRLELWSLSKFFILIISFYLKQSSINMQVSFQCLIKFCLQRTLKI